MRNNSKDALDRLSKAMKRRQRSRKHGAPRPKRVAIFYLDQGQPRVIRDRIEGLTLLLADLRRTERQIVGIGSDAQARQAQGAVAGEPRKERLIL